MIRLTNVLAQASLACSARLHTERLSSMPLFEYWQLWTLPASPQVQYRWRTDVDCSQLHQHLRVRRWTPERARRWDSGYDVSEIPVSTGETFNFRIAGIIKWKSVSGQLNPSQTVWRLNPNRDSSESELPFNYKSKLQYIELRMDKLTHGISCTSHSITLLPSPHTSRSPLGWNELSKRVRRGSPAWPYTTLKGVQVSVPSQQFPLNLLERVALFRGANSSWAHSWFLAKPSSLFTSRGFDCRYSRGWWERRPVHALCPPLPYLVFLYSTIIFLWFCSVFAPFVLLSLCISAELSRATPGLDQYSACHCQSVCQSGKPFKNPEGNIITIKYIQFIMPASDPLTYHHAKPMGQIFCLPKNSLYDRLVYKQKLNSSQSQLWD